MSKIEDTLAQRGGTYGDFREQGRITQNLKRAMQDSPNWWRLPAYIREGLDTIQVKVSRILNGNPLYDDNYHDIVGYAKLMEDRAAQDVENGVVFEGGGDPMYPTYEHEGRGETVTVGCITIPASMAEMNGQLPTDSMQEEDPPVELGAVIKRVLRVIKNAIDAEKQVSTFWITDIQRLAESPTRNAAILIRSHRTHIENIRRIVSLTDMSDADKVAQIKQLMGDA